MQRCLVKTQQCTSEEAAVGNTLFERLFLFVCFKGIFDVKIIHSKRSASKVD